MKGDKTPIIIQHEVEHYWQENKANKDFSSKRYANAFNLSQSTNNALEKYIGYLFYFTHKFEIDAFINGAYNIGYRNQYRIKTFNDFLKYSKINELFSDLEDVVDGISCFNFDDPQIKNNLKEIHDLLDLKKSFELTKENINKIAKDARIYIIKKAKRAFKL